MNLTSMLDELLHVLEVGHLQKEGGQCEIVLSYRGLDQLSPVKQALVKAIEKAWPGLNYRRLSAPADLEPELRSEVIRKIRNALQRLNVPSDVREEALAEFDDAVSSLTELENRRELIRSKES